MTCASLSESTMPSPIDPMIRDNLDTIIIAHDRNLIIMISFIQCYVSWSSLIDLRTLSIHLINEHQYNEGACYSNIKHIICPKGDFL